MTAADDHRDVRELVRDTLARVLAVPRTRIDAGARLTADLRADSLDLVEAVEIVERSLRDRGRDVRVPEGVLASCQTVGDLVDGVARALRAPNTDGADASQHDADGDANAVS